MRGFGDASPSRGNRQRMSDLVEIIPWPTDGNYMAVRMVGPVYSIANVWFTISTPRKPDGTPIPKQCLDHDGETDRMVTDICPYRKSGKGRLSKTYYVNVIVRHLQVDARDRELTFPVPRGEPEVRLGYKAYWGKKGDERKTPVRVLEIPESQVSKIQQLQKLNRVKTEDGIQSMELSDVRYGCDISVMIDPTKKGAAKYDIQKGDRTPLTPAERRYILFPLNLLKPERLEDAKREMADLEPRIIDDRKKDSRGGGRDSGRGSSGSGSGRGKSRDDEDPLLEDETKDVGMDDLDDEPRGRGRGRDRDDPPARGRGRDRGRDDDLDDLDGDEGSDLDDDLGSDLDGDLDDLDDEPRGRGRGRDRDDDDDASRGRGRGRDDDDEDEPGGRRRGRGRGRDADLDDEDYAPRGRGRGRDDDDEDDAPFDEDDEPRGRGRGRDRDDDRGIRRRR